MPIIDQNELYQFVRFRVAGVTFKNGRRSRQTILRRIYWKDEPYHRFDGEKDVGLRLTEFDGQPAVEVWVRGKTVRNRSDGCRRPSGRTSCRAWNVSPGYRISRCTAAERHRTESR